MLELNMLTLRSGLHTLRKLLPTVSPDERAVAKVRHHVPELFDKQDKVTGRHMLLERVRGTSTREAQN